MKIGKKSGKRKVKRSAKNLKISTRIAITSVLAIVIPITALLSFSPILVNTISSYFNFSSVTTNTYSAINLIQWNQTVSSITDELISEESDSNKLENLTNFVAPLEKLRSLIYIERNGKIFYQTENSGNILEKASAVTSLDLNKNQNYFGSNGLLIVTHAGSGSERYTIVIVNYDYTVNDASQKLSIQELTGMLVGRTGIIVLITVLLFVAAIAVISFITGQTIVKPIKKISRGADEIARGNLDYEIDYKSTNELGQMAENFNQMRQKLKQSIVKQNESEEKRKVLIAGIAHDLRTPLTSVKGYAEGLADGIADTPQKQKRYFKTIKESIENMEKILNDLQNVSRLELSDYNLNKADVSVKEFFDDGVQEIKALLDSKDFDLEYENKCSPNTLIYIDSDRFSRVIANIISNSIKYARDDIKSMIRISIDEYERSVIIEISDNGIGVEQENLSKIFDTMYRTDPARTRVSQGSGLGLAVCRQIVELHSGSIWARSGENGGLSIFISLPKHDKNDPS